MSRTLVVAARELRERWLLLPAGLAVGLLPLVLPAFGLDAARVPKFGSLLAVLFGVTAAAIVGGSMLARDTADGRLGFLFSRPVHWLTIWGGKWLAAVTLVFGGAALAALPLAALDHTVAPDSWFKDGELSALLALVLVLGLGFANFNATAFRSRSPWLALDLGFLLLALWLVWRWVAPLYLFGIFGNYPYAPAEWTVLLPIIPVAVAFILASAAQTAWGRTDIRRAHRAMSIAFWSVVFVTLAAAGVRLAWVRSASPADLVVHGGSRSPSGRWLYVSGESKRGGWMTFLLDTESERHLWMGLDRPFEGPGATGMAFSADGESGVTLVRHGDGSALDIADLTGDDPRFTVVPLESSPPPAFGTRLALSPSGNTVLLAHEHGASLFATESGQRVATATIAPGWRAASARFAAETTARVFLIPSIGRFASSPRTEMQILEIAAGREARTTTVPLAAPVDPVRAWPAFARPDAGGRRFLTLDDGVRLRDGGTGALLATLVEGAGPFQILFVADGRIVVGEPSGARTALHVFAPDGTSQGDVTFDQLATGLEVGPEVAPGRIAVHFGGFFADRETVVVDLSRGRVVETLPGLRRRQGFWMLDEPPHAPGGGVPAVHFFRGENGAVVRRDFTTGEQRVVAGPGAPVGERLELR